MKTHSYRSSCVESKLQVLNVWLNRRYHTWQNRRLQYGSDLSILDEEKVCVQICQKVKASLSEWNGWTFSCLFVRIHNSCKTYFPTVIRGPFLESPNNVTAQKCLIFRSRSKKTKKQFLAAKTVHLFSLLINLSYHLQNYWNLDLWRKPQ